jgi:hypothetical protein
MKRLFLLVSLVNGFWWAALQTPANAPYWQVPTPTLPTLRAEAYDQDVNVRSGPGTDYERVGTLVRGQSGAILGQAQTVGVWLKIVYIGGPENTGWVSQDVVKVVGDLGQAPTLMPPPTPTLPPVPTQAVTTTVEALGTPGTGTLAPGTLEAGRLPTFTPPPPVAFPTLLPVQGLREDNGFPPAILIISLFVLGGFGMLISLLRRR